MLPRPAFALAGLLLLATAAAGAEPTRDTPRLVRVPVASPDDLQRLVDTGFDVVERRAGYAHLLTIPADEEALARLGIPVELLDPAPGATAAARAHAELATRPAAPGTRVRTRVQTTGSERVVVAVATEAREHPTVLRDQEGGIVRRVEAHPQTRTPICDHQKGVARLDFILT